MKSLQLYFYTGKMVSHVVLTFESVDQILWCVHSKGTFITVILYMQDAICLILVLLQFYSLIICICELQGFGGKTLDLFFFQTHLHFANL